MRIPEEFDDSRIPIRVGNPLKVPDYAWCNWGISYEVGDEFEKLVKLSEDGYREEWDSTGSDRHNYIAEASRMAGLEDANERLNVATAKVIESMVEKAEGLIRILDLGAGTGNTTFSIIQRLNSSNMRKVFFVLIDPASEAIQEAKKSLSQTGLVEGKHFEVVVSTDLNAGKYIRQESIDIIVAVASIHHHAHLEAPLGVVHTICKKGGFFLTGDWHNSMWEHPRNVYELLSDLEWEGKEFDLRNFVRIYPKAQEQAGKAGELERKANDQIKEFWKQYGKLKITKSNRSMILEGHRPVERYFESMTKIGFLTDTGEIRVLMPRNPDLLIPGSSLLCLCFGQKGG